MNSNWSWIKVCIAACFEVLWVVGLKHADNVWAWIGTLIAIFISFYLLIMAGEDLPVGTVYAVYVGIGTMGTVISEILFFGEQLKLEKMILILVLLIGVIGLKLVTKGENEKGVD